MEQPNVSSAIAIPQRTADEELWSLKIVLANTGLSRSTLYADVADGALPVQRRLGPKRVAWLASAVRAWILSRARP
jgi:prophage regulatory protein